MNSKNKKWLAITGKALIGLLVATMAVFTFLTLSQRGNDGIPKIFGSSVLTVLTDSMKGTGKDNFKAGDLIIVKQLNAEQVKSLSVGNIITFRDIVDGQRAYNTHRIIEINDSDGILSFITKGDNNSIADNNRRLVTDVVGVYNGTKIAGGGNVMSFIQSKWGFFFCLVFPLALFFLWSFYKLMKSIIAYRSFVEIEANSAKPDGKLNTATNAKVEPIENPIVEANAEVVNVDES